MCAFWTRGIFKEPYFLQNNIKYYWRLDTDSRILAQIKYDIFEFIKRRKVVYAFRSRQWEASWMVNGLSMFIHNYAKKNKIELWNLPVLKELTNSTSSLDQYYTNFEMVYIPAFRDDPEVSSWLEEVWLSGGNYRYRWGDGPLRYYTVHLFPKLYKKLHHFCDIKYSHQMFSFEPTCNHSMGS